MYKKRHLVITAAVTALVVFLSTSIYFLETGGRIGGDDIIKAKKLIADNYVDKLTEEQLTKMDDAAISAMVESLGDPYSRYLNATDMEEYEEDSQEEYVGIGVSITFDPQNNILTVVSPYDQSPAQKAGLQPGDRIMKVDGVEVSSDTYSDILDHIKGENAKKGDAITLAVKREGNGDAFDVQVVRDSIVIQTISKKMYGSGIGYIRVSEFKDHTSKDFETAINELKTDGMKGLIIDLRNNPGGYAHTVLQMADMLLPEGTIAYLEDNKGEREYFKSDSKELGLPMVVLINKGTASASELLAGSLQAYGLATIVGEKSFGKAVGQTPLPLTKDTAIYLTNARYYTPKGNWIDKIGIEPDVPLELPKELRSKINTLELSQDNQLSKAIEILQGKIGA